MNCQNRRLNLLHMKRTVYLSLAAMICACTAQTGLPDINAGWNFTADDGRAALVDLPHDAMMGASRSADVPCGGPEAFFQGGKYIYTKT